jgi:PAS domain S-box-containing protein
MLGYTGEQLRRLTYQELTPERWHAFETRIVTEQILARGHSEVYEKEFRRPDGTVLPVELRVYLRRNETDEPVGMWAIVRDIRGRKRDEQAIREGEQRLRIAKDAAKLGIYEYDVATRNILWDARVREFWGLGPDVPVTIDTFFSGLHPDDRARTQVLLDRALDPAGDGEYYADYRVISQADGSVRWIAATGKVFFENGRPTHMIGMGQDVSEQKRAEATLRESEERFRNMADTAPVLIWVSGPDKRPTFFNKPWLEFTGRTMNQEMGDDWAAGTHPDDRDRCFATYSSSFDARRSFRMEYRLRRADGEYRWVLDNGTPRYRESEFAGFIGSCIDVTEQKRVEEELRRNQAQLIDSQRLARVGSWEADMTTGRLRWSEEMYRIYGVQRDARTDFQTFLSRVHPKDRGIIPEAQKKALSADTPVSVEFRIIRPDGEVRFVRSMVEALRNDEGALVRFSGAAQDITEQVKATELLRESEARLTNAERMTHVGSWTWDIEPNRASWSEEMFRIMGQPREHKPSYDPQAIAPADRERVEQWIQHCLAEKRGSPIEARIVRPNGELRTVVVTSDVLLDEDGSPERLSGACQDVTDARRAQEESFARQKLESLGTLAGGIAHDFNNLLGAMLAQTELAMAELATGSRPDGELQAIRDVAIRGSEIVRQLMVYAGKESDVLEPVDVSKVVEGMLGLLKVTVSRHAALVTDLGEGLPAVRARTAQLSQIVINLVVNASEAIGAHEGVIRVSTERIGLGPAEAAAKALPPGDYVRLEVSDTGRGMSPETQAKVFDPFFSTKFSGRGLGLAVVHGIVRSVRGAIQVASEPGKGTTFQVLLPCEGAVAKLDPGSIIAIDEPVPAARRATVLLVEDEEHLRLAVAKILGRSGLETFEAANGTAAIDLLRASGGTIDLILLDLTIPGSSSQEVLAEAALARPDVKVILTSAYSEEEAKPMMREPVVCGFIRKPFKLGDLVQTLRTVLFP